MEIKRTLQITVMFLVAVLLGLLFGSNCKGLWLSVVFIAVLSLLTPCILLATGRLKVPLIKSVSNFAFIGFSLFGIIALLAGLFGSFSDAGFLANACTGTDLATKITLKTLGYATKGL